MRREILTESPQSFDELGRPVFRTKQNRSLLHQQDHRLYERALREGYTTRIAKRLKRRVEVVLRNLEVDSGLRILEIGGGQGAFFDQIVDIADSYVNCDPGQFEPDEDWWRRKEDARFLALNCSAELMPLQEGYFDAAVSIASLDHIPNHNEALREIERVLRPGGKFVLTINNRGSWWKKALGWTPYLKRRQDMIADSHFFQWNVPECRENLEEHFRVDAITTEPFLPFIPKLWAIALPVADWIGNRISPHWGANIVAVCSKRSY